MGRPAAIPAEAIADRTRTWPAAAAMAPARYTVTVAQRPATPRRITRLLPLEAIAPPLVQVVAIEVEAVAPTPAGVAVVARPAVVADITAGNNCGTWKCRAVSNGRPFLVRPTATISVRFACIACDA
jgi:hypothetical protein